MIAHLIPPNCVFLPLDQGTGGDAADDGCGEPLGAAQHGSAEMTPGSDGTAAADGTARHIPVLPRHAVDWLGVRSNGLYIDATFGAGGYTRAILETAGARVIGIDRDQSAIAQGTALVEAAQGRLDLVEDRFSNLEAACRQRRRSTASSSISAFLRCRSTRPRADFRFGSTDRWTCAWAGMVRTPPILSHAPANAISLPSSPRWEKNTTRGPSPGRSSGRAAKRAIDTTRALAEIVARVVHAREGAIHPATRTFQALRIFVNDELGELAGGLAAAERVLKPSGRVVVVAFHSLEDRIVKTFLIERSRAPAGSRHRPEIVAPPPSFRVLTRRPETPDEAEIAANPRARSAKLRAAERTEAAPHSAAIEHLLPRLPSATDIMRGRP